jgi:hypothetical protein
MSEQHLLLSVQLTEPDLSYVAGAIAVSTPHSTAKIIRSSSWQDYSQPRQTEAQFMQSQPYQFRWVAGYGSEAQKDIEPSILTVWTI